MTRCHTITPYSPLPSFFPSCQMLACCREFGCAVVCQSCCETTRLWS